MTIIKERIEGKNQFVYVVTDKYRKIECCFRVSGGENEPATYLHYLISRSKSEITPFPCVDSTDYFYGVYSKFLDDLKRKFLGNEEVGYSRLEEIHIVYARRCHTYGKVSSLILTLSHLTYLPFRLLCRGEV